VQVVLSWALQPLKQYRNERKMISCCCSTLVPVGRRKGNAGSGLRTSGGLAVELGRIGQPPRHTRKADFTLEDNEDKYPSCFQVIRSQWTVLHEIFAH
jgi:hypothetical protein